MESVLLFWGGVIWMILLASLTFGIASLDMWASISGGNEFQVEGRTVIITGGSQGMGRGLAKLLSSKGANVVIVARNVQKLEDAHTYISNAAINKNKQKFLYISADVTKPDENERIIREVTAWNNSNPPDIVWANAGCATPGLFLDTSVTALRAQMDIDYWAAVYLAQATLRVWLKQVSEPNQKHFEPGDEPEGSERKPHYAIEAPLPRHFIITSSVAAFAGLAGYTPYAPAKAALRSLHDTLRSEINMYEGAMSNEKPRRTPEVKPHIVFPGTILSPGLDEENKVKHPVTKILEEGDLAQTEDEIAVATVKELEKGRQFISTQMLGAAMRASSLQGTPRDRWFVDTIFSWIVAIAWLFIAPDMAGKVKKWGRKNGMPTHAA